jgi:hypothetical protein
MPTTSVATTHVREMSPLEQAIINALNESSKINSGPTSEELDISNKINNIISSRDMGIANLEGQGRGIPMEILGAQEKRLLEQSGAQLGTLQNQLALLQAKRNADIENQKTKAQAALDIAKTLYGFERDRLDQSRPISLSEGSALVDPITGKVITSRGKTYAPSSTSSSSGSTYTQESNPSVDSWVSLIRSGQAKITNVPAGLKNAVSMALNENGGQINPIAKQNMENALDVIGTLESHKGLGDAVGIKGPSSLFGILKAPISGTAAAGFLAQLERLKGLLSLDSLKQLRGLGAMSDREFATIQSSVAALNPSMKESEFRSELNRIKKALLTSLGGTSANKLPPTMVLNGQTLTLQADGTYK